MLINMSRGKFDEEYWTLITSEAALMFYTR